MSGHSKWANIKRKKEANDKLKGNLFSKLSRMITVAVIEGGGITDPSLNSKLRLAMEKAQSLNMPKENMKRAIERGVGQRKDQLQEIIYEGFAPHGVSLLILATTDNPNRTFAEVKTTLEKAGGKIAQTGSVSYQFEKCGLIVFDKNKVTEEKILEISEKLRASDVEEDEEGFSLYFPYELIGKISHLIPGVAYKRLEIDFKPKIKTMIVDEKIEEIARVVDLLESLDDVQKVFTNLQ
ncbi:MAG: YebC/PmpR family DNA-binding transcriptional regulator [Patescibacteria group bacterium]|nr:YebC/PmpR family DNA-binding transcriptional regulator [Patescibacteria group bacterium]